MIVRGLLLLGFLIQTAFAQNRVPEIMPAPFEGNLIQGVPQSYACMSGQITTVAQNVINQTDAQDCREVNFGSLNLAVKCPQEGALQKDLDCKKLSSNGKYDPELTEKVFELNRSVKCALLCKSQQLNMFNSEIACLQDQAQQLEAMMGSVRQGLSNAITKMNEDLEHLSEMGAFLQRRLRGDGGQGGTGEPGLLDLEKELQAQVVQLPKLVAATEKAYAGLENEKKFLESIKDAKRVGYAKTCFESRPVPNFKCSKKGGSVAPLAYLECMTNQAARRAGGYVQRGNSRTKINAGRQARKLKALLTNIFGDISGEADGSAEGIARLTGSKLLVRSVEDVIRIYGSQLRAMESEFFGSKKAGIPIYDFTVSVLRNCFKRAGAAVARESRIAGTTIYRQQEKIKDLERDTDAAYKENLFKASDLFNKTYRNLIGQARTIPGLQTCESGKPSQKIHCIRELRIRLQGLLNGNYEGGDAVINVEGVAGRRGFPLRCRGIQACIRVSQNAYQRLRINAKRFVTQARSQTERLFTRVAGQLQGINARMVQHVQTMNTTLANLGVSPGLFFQQVKPEELRFGPNGLPLVPQNMRGVLGSMMAPPMLDVGGATLGQSMGGIAARNQQIEQKLAEARASKYELSTMNDRCLEDDLAELRKAMQEQFNTWQNSDCAYSKEICDGGKEEFQALHDNLRTEGDGTTNQFFDSQISSLINGVRGMCEDPSYFEKLEKYKVANAKKTRSESELRGLQDEERTLKEQKLRDEQGIRSRITSEISQLRTQRGDVLARQPQGSAEVQEVRRIDRQIAAKNAEMTAELDQAAERYRSDIDAARKAADAKRSQLAQIDELKVELGEIKNPSQNRCNAVRNDLYNSSTLIADLQRRRGSIQSRGD